MKFFKTLIAVVMLLVFSPAFLLGFVVGLIYYSFRGGFETSLDTLVDIFKTINKKELNKQKDEI